MSDEINIKIWSEEADPDWENHPSEFFGEISGGGYIRDNCRNITNFYGSYYLYRLYEHESMDDDEPSYEFQFEIPVPLSLSCPDCDSSKLLVEYNKGWCFEFQEDKFEVLVGDKRLISFEDADGDFELLKLLGCDPDSIMYGKASNLLDQMQEWEGDFESFEKNDCAIVRIYAKGGLVQEEYGLSGGDATYKGLEFTSWNL